MSRINGGRVVIGGLAAGVAMNVIDAVSNGMLLGAQWKAESDQLNPGLVAKAASLSTVGWIIVDFLMGLLIVFTVTYAGPRIGVAATVGILIAGQLAMGAAIDRFGLFGTARIERVR